MPKTITIPTTVNPPPLQPDEILPAYDYSVLPDDLATEAREAVETIRANIATINVSILEIGHALQMMKDKLPHGEFGPWLEREVEISQRQADRFMLAYKEFGGKLDSLSNLPKTLIYTLSAPSTPAEVKAEVLAEISAGKPPTTASVAAKIKATKTASPAKSEKLVKKQAKAGTDAVQMIVTALGADIVKFLELYSVCGPWGFQDAVKAIIKVEAA